MVTKKKKGGGGQISQGNSQSVALSKMQTAHEAHKKKEKNVWTVNLQFFLFRVYFHFDSFKLLQLKEIVSGSAKSAVVLASESLYGGC